MAKRDQGKKKTPKNAIQGTRSARAKLALKNSGSSCKLDMGLMPNNSQGSEHTMDGKACPSELHLVHCNMKYVEMNACNWTAALSNEDGLAVVGIMFEVNDKSSKKYFAVIFE